MATEIHTKSNASRVNAKSSKKKGNLLLNVVGNVKAKRKAKKIIKALNEAKQIHKGKRKGKSFDEFLDGL